MGRILQFDSSVILMFILKITCILQYTGSYLPWCPSVGSTIRYWSAFEHGTCFEKWICSEDGLEESYRRDSVGICPWTATQLKVDSYDTEVFIIDVVLYYGPQIRPSILTETWTWRTCRISKHFLSRSLWFLISSIIYGFR